MKKKEQFGKSFNNCLLWLFHTNNIKTEIFEKNCNKIWNSLKSNFFLQYLKQISKLSLKYNHEHFLKLLHEIFLICKVMHIKKFSFFPKDFENLCFITCCVVDKSKRTWICLIIASTWPVLAYPWTQNTCYDVYKSIYRKQTYVYIDSLILGRDAFSLLTIFSIISSCSGWSLIIAINTSEMNCLSMQNDQTMTK